MRIPSPYINNELNFSHFKKLLPFSLYALFPLSLFCIFLYPITLTQPLFIDRHSPLSPKDKCDYGNGKWVSDKMGPLYNDTSCETIKDGQNCINNGRPDTNYLYWRWRPHQNQCKISRFNPMHFLSLTKNKHLAFIGDSMARNQLESLLCMISSFSQPILVYTSGYDNKFRRWNFPSYNLTISIYWSPFLVKGIEKSDQSINYNRLYLESVDETWASNIDYFDMVVLSVGHWFLHPAVYYYNGAVIGCHSCGVKNITEVGFYKVFGKAIKTSLETIIKRRGHQRSEGYFHAIVTTFSPHHFEGEWDKFGACPKTRPLDEGEKDLEGMNMKMRKVAMNEIDLARVKAKESSRKIRLEGLDVTKLALLRADGHPGPYMYANPFGNGIKERVQNDCVHWCMPGAIDTWNEILLEMMKSWHRDDKMAL
ncbi:xyloglucan O-acetyltransferase 1-like [Impatiens glandulifera]|uniref:xyloglucan O-acetyltransferase 1-like n=1 Tax=Impatiens glandulifera TaxID=253017 RepID=UPI001FB0962C|nr:xyloglucan O-acetyltransferase 1-like [Impatiens glandulifera]